MTTNPATPDPPLVLRVPQTGLRHPDGRCTRLIGLKTDQAETVRLLEPAGFVPDGSVSPESARLLCFASHTPAAVVRDAYTTLDRHLPGSVDLLHPAAVTGWLGLPPHQRFAVTGYSGFGNMLLQAVLREIDQALRPPGMEDSAAPLVTRAEHHTAALRELLEASFAEIARSRATTLRDYVVAPGWLADCTARARS